MASPYKKWVANADPTNDWTTERILANGERIKMGEPTQITADQVKDLEAKGLVFEESSAAEHEAYFSQPGVRQPVGSDVRGTAPVFVDPETGVNQNATPPGEGDDNPNDDKKK